MVAARHAVEFILAHQEPYPAVMVDRHWNVLRANAATQRVMARFLDGPPRGGLNAMRAVFDPAGLRPCIENWDEVAHALIERIHREAEGPGDAETRALRDELLAYPGVPARWRSPQLDRPPVPLLSIVYRKGDLRLAFFTTITTFGTPQDVTLQELRIECFFPADEATRAALAADAGPGCAG